MILYTPLQLELILENFDNIKYPEYRIISYKDIPILVEDTDGGKMRIIKLLSTNPYHYLYSELEPGNILG